MQYVPALRSYIPMNDSVPKDAKMATTEKACDIQGLQFF